MSKIRKNFIYPEIKREHHRFGVNSVEAPDLREDGDWRDYTPPDEKQNVRGIESSACYIEASQHAIAIVEEEQFKIIDNNYSARYNALLSDGTPDGGDPIAGGDSIRWYGLIPDAMMPFSDEIESWQDFHSWMGVDETACRVAGRKDTELWKRNHSIVYERHEPFEVKFDKLAKALKKGPVCISVWGKVGPDGNYLPKPSTAQDTHLVVALYIDHDNCIWIRDTYEPFTKKLPPYYNSDFGMSWTVSKIEPPKPDPIKEKEPLLSVIWKWIVKQVKILRYFYKHTE